MNPGRVAVPVGAGFGATGGAVASAPARDAFGSTVGPGRATGTGADGAPLKPAPLGGVPGVLPALGAAGTAGRETAPGPAGSSRGARTCVDAPGGGLAFPAPALGVLRGACATGGALVITGADVASDTGTFTRFVATGFRPTSAGAATAEMAPGTAMFEWRAGGAVGRTVTFTA